MTPGKNLIVFDTEDDSSELLKRGGSGFDKKLTQIAAISSNGKRFYNAGAVKPFLKWCHETGGDVWAFNAQYDIGNLCHAGEINLDDFDLTLVKGRFIKGKFQGLNFYDVHNLSGAGSSVKSLGLAVGLPKFGADYSAKELRVFSAKRRAEFFAFNKTGAEKFADPRYVFRDCEIPLRWLEFVADQADEIGVESLPATLGGLCVKTFAAMGGQNWFQADDETAAALIGARVELFSGGGKGRICYADVNSLYPWCMTQLFPVCVEDLDGSLDGYGIADCLVDVPDQEITPLPYRDGDGRLIFPVGKFRGVWTLAEIRNAVNFAGAKVKKVYWSHGSKHGKAFYRDYITSIYGKRMAATSPAENLFWKLLLNNLYGRLAISGEVSRSLILTDENKDRGLAYGGKVLVDHKMPLPVFSNYMHAAHVLSYARIKLFSYLKMIPAKDLIYCDTDSVIFFCKDQPPFPASRDLGAMKIEAWGARCKPYLPKTYIFDNTYKAKGVPKSRARDFIETGRAEYDLPFKLREAIHFYNAENTRKLSVWRKVEKIRAAVYDRKKICGKYFLPIKLNEAK